MEKPNFADSLRVHVDWSSQEVCRLILVTQPCMLWRWMRQQLLTMTHCTCDDVCTLHWSGSGILKKRRMAHCWPMFIVYGTPGGARLWKNRSWKTLCFGGEALLRFCNHHLYQGPWSFHREQGGGNKRYVIPHGTQREGKKRERDVGVWQWLCLPFFFFPPLLLTSCSTPLHPVYSWLGPGVWETERSHRVVDILGW